MTDNFGDYLIEWPKKKKKKIKRFLRESNPPFENWRL